MKLAHVKIENFRSIESETITFDIPFRILVGRNESGKSNILKALSYLNPKGEIENSDIRKGLNVEDSDPESSVNFTFTLNESEVNGVYKKLLTKIAKDDKLKIEEVVVAKDANRLYTLKQLCYRLNTALYWIDINEGERHYTYWKLTDQFHLASGIDWLFKIDEDLHIEGPANQIIINAKDSIEESIADTFEPMTSENLYELISGLNAQLLRNNLPNVINWQFKEADMMMERIDIDAFINKPDDFKPLKSMFELAGVERIKEALTSRRSPTDYHPLNNYLEKIARKTTEHSKSVWPEYEEISFTLNADGNSIITGIKEKNTYSFRQRSDGFKRFATFLLMISASYKTNGLKETLLLIDEPDVTLHPSGIKSLRDELIRISQDNYIVASTHSIFLIDRNKINRHYLIDKKKEVTSIVETNDENLVSEEVLYRALGFSFYETLEPKNLIFEGWKDKELFRVAMEKVPSEIKEIKTLKTYGITHINGVKEAQTASSYLELGKRELIILSDSDDAAIIKQRNFQKEKYHGTWLTYKDLEPDLDKHTGEDFLKTEYLLSCLTKFKKDHPEISESNIQFSGKETVINIVKAFKDVMADEVQAKKLASEFKDVVFTNLKPSQIDIKYYDYLKKLYTRIMEIWPSDPA